MKRMGRERGPRRAHHGRKSEAETAGRAEVDGEIRRPRNVGCWGLRCVSGAKFERGSRGARGGARLPFNEAEGHEGGRSHDARALNGGSALTGSGRGTREVGGGADRWGPGVSGWARAVAGCGRCRGARLLGWARLGRRGARGWAERERGGLGRWLWCWAAGKEMAMGPNERKGRNGRNFPFFFL